MVFRKRVQILAILLWTSFVPSVALAAGQQSSTEAYLQQLHNQGKERVIVLFDNEADPNLPAGYDAKVIRKLKIINALVCEIDQSDIELLKQEANVKNVVPDILIKFPRPRQTEAQPMEMTPLSYEGPVTVKWNNLEAGLNAKAAWDNYNLDGTGVKIAFLDTGVNYTMENLDDNYLGGEDFVEDDGDPLTTDVDENHGTKVVSLAVGEGTNKVVGVAYNANYYVVKVLDKDNIGFISDFISGIQWASTEPHKADIISMSLGTYNPEPGLKNALKNACNNAYTQGIVVVAASGNSGYSYSSYPAAFANVISVGAHAEDQTLYDYNGKSTNGGVDVIAPGARVYTIKPDNSAWWVWGTSFAAPHVSALIALQLQYARERGIEVNNGYLWEVMKEAAIDLGLDPVYQGKGKIWAARTDANDPNLGSIDLMAHNWPIDYDFQFTDFAFADSNYPVYHIGNDVNQNITITNITDTLGNRTETIENLNVIATQVNYAGSNEPNLPGDSIKVFPAITLLEPGDTNSINLSLLYTIPPQTTPGLKKTKLELEFNFLGNSRTLKVTYNNPNSLWYAAIPSDLDLNNSVDLSDFATFAHQWQQTDCNDPNWCGRADIDRSRSVDWSDLDILAKNWLSGLQ